MNRLVSTALVLALLAPSAPAFAAELSAPSELPCEGAEGKARARCITDALKAWKGLEHDYDQNEDDEVDAWKADHAHMGIGSDYQIALRTFLKDVRERRKEFAAQILAFRKTFFAEQKAKLKQGDGRKATEVKLEKATLDAAKAVCGIEDDDGAYRLCMRIQLRKKTVNVDKRSRTNSKVIHQ